MGHQLRLVRFTGLDEVKPDLLIFCRLSSVNAQSPFRRSGRESSRVKSANRVQPFRAVFKWRRVYRLNSHRTSDWLAFRITPERGTGLDSMMPSCLQQHGVVVPGAGAKAGARRDAVIAEMINPAARHIVWRFCQACWNFFHECDWQPGGRSGHAAYVVALHVRSTSRTALVIIHTLSAALLPDAIARRSVMKILILAHHPGGDKPETGFRPACTVISTGVSPAPACFFANTASERCARNSAMICCGSLPGKTHRHQIK